VFHKNSIVMDLVYMKLEWGTERNRRNKKRL